MKGYGNKIQSLCVLEKTARDSTYEQTLELLLIDTKRTLIRLNLDKETELNDSVPPRVKELTSDLLDYLGRILPSPSNLQALHEILKIGAASIWNSIEHILPR